MVVHIALYFTQFYSHLGCWAAHVVYGCLLEQLLHAVRQVPCVRALLVCLTWNKYLSVVYKYWSMNMDLIWTNQKTVFKYQIEYQIRYHHHQPIYVRCQKKASPDIQHIPTCASWFHCIPVSFIISFNDSTFAPTVPDQIYCAILIISTEIAPNGAIVEFGSVCYRQWTHWRVKTYAACSRGHRSDLHVPILFPRNKQRSHMCAK